MQIVKYPDPILLTRSEPVEITKELKNLIDEMYVFMQTQLHWGRPVGLAAPQIGKNIRVFIALDNTYINPEILWKSEQTKLCMEGCYSLKENKFDYRIHRPTAIHLKWQDKKGKWHEQRFEGLKAQVIQHEFDHLEGRLCNNEKAINNETMDS